MACAYVMEIHTFARSRVRIPGGSFLFLEEFLGIFRRDFGTPTVFPHGDGNFRVIDTIFFQKSWFFRHLCVFLYAEHDDDVYFHRCIDPTLIFKEDFFFKILNFF